MRLLWFIVTHLRERLEGLKCFSKGSSVVHITITMSNSLDSLQENDVWELNEELASV